MQVRDRLVAVVLAAGLLLGMVAWQGVGPWLGVGAAVLALAGASVIYRVDRHRSDEDPPPEPGAEISTRRRAAGRP